MADLRPQIEAAGWYMGGSESGVLSSESGVLNPESEVEGDVLSGKSGVGSSESGVLSSESGVQGRHDGVLNPLAPDSYRDGQHDRDIIAGTKTVERDLKWDEDEVMDESEAWPN